MTERHRSSTGIGRGALLLVAIVAVAIGIWFGLRYHSAGPDSGPMVVNLKSATLLPTPKPLEDFSLLDQDDRPVDRDALTGRWTFLAFGYTHCPDICPTMMATFDALERKLADSGAAPQPDFLFISVDPERDTPQRVGEYVGFFNPRIRGATAGHEVLRPLTAQLGILYQRSAEQETAMGYLVDHSASMLLLDPQARLAAIFGLPHHPPDMARDFRTISSGAHSIP